MQRSACIILLPLFLCTLFGVISVSYSYSAIIGENNKKGAYLLTFATVHPTQLAIMPPKSRTTRKRMLLEDDHDSVNLDHAQSRGESLSTEGDMGEMTDNQPFNAAISENFFADEATPSTRRRKKRGLHHNGASENLYCVENEVTDAVGQHDKQFQSNQENPNTMINQSLFAGESSSNNAGNTIVGGSSFFGQASYQRNKQGVIIKYEDFGDNSFTCIHCNASFWLKEANKQKLKNAPIIYRNCCEKGEIKIEQSNPTPSFLEQLLDPKNRESTFFRENIRIYNSMFSFTSMGATIDHGINNGSGPYVFKINGQVHHLMGSMLPLDGECPKYAQLYIYDTKNEVSNRINAIDPSHINKKIRPDIVQGLINMFNEINELVKTYRTIRDKFEDSSLPSLNMTMLNRQPIDSKQYEEPTSEEIGGLIVGDIGEFNSNKDIVIISGCSLDAYYFLGFRHNVPPMYSTVSLKIKA